MDNSHKNFKDFQKGYDAGCDDIQSMGAIAARDKFNSENPIGYKPESFSQYAFDKGYFEALCDLFSK